MILEKTTIGSVEELLSEVCVEEVENNNHYVDKALFSKELLLWKQEYDTSLY